MEQVISKNVYNNVMQAIIKMYNLWNVLPHAQFLNTE